jgi:hypothetical protein
VKKTTVAKKAPAKKTARKSTTGQYAKGDTLICEVCGLGVIVDTACGCGEACAVICCEQPMIHRKARGSKTKVAAR